MLSVNHIAFCNSLRTLHLQWVMLCIPVVMILIIIKFIYELREWQATPIGWVEQDTCER